MKEGGRARPAARGRLLAQVEGEAVDDLRAGDKLEDGRGDDILIHVEGTGVGRIAA